MSELRLLDRLDSHAKQRADALAYRFIADNQSIAARNTLTWGQLARAVNRVSDWLSARIPAGQTLLVSSGNRIEVPVIHLAALAAGVRLLPVSPELSDVELRRIVEQSRPAAVVVGSNSSSEAMRDVVPNVWLIEKVWPNADSREPSGASEIAPAAVTHDGGGLILQSSGTTGLPKLVFRSANSLDAVSEAMAESVGLLADDRVLALLPLSHSYGIEHGLLAPVWAGCTVLQGRGLDVSVVIRELQSGATVFPTVPSVIEMLAELPGDAMQLPALRRIYSAGGPLPRAVFDRFQSRYGARVSQLYGATEIGSVLFNSPDDPNFDPASVGRPMRGVEVRIVDVEQPHRALPPNEEGQIAVRAASMFDGYLDAPTPLIDGFFPTGDLGRLDATGRLTITGRIKLLIEVGGMKVNPLEVEAVLREHPRVQSCVVVPIRQSQTMFRIKAIVTPRDPENPPDVAELRALARQRLAGFKVPRVFEIRTALPMTATGKVLRHLVETI